MAPNPQRPERQDNVFSSLNVAIEVLNITKEILSITPAKAVCGSVGVILATVRDSMINEIDYVELGLACADICTALGRGMEGKKADDLNQSVRDATAQLVTTVTEIQRKVIKQSKRKAVSRLFHAKNDKETIVAWKSDLNRILHVFNTELSINTHVIVSDIRRDVVNTHTLVSDVRQGVADTRSVVSELHHNVTDTHTIVSDIHRVMVENRDGTGGKNLSTQNSVSGEAPPPPPRACFGRDELIENIVGLAENLTPIALIGPGGIGKTSVALTILHHDRIKTRFGENRRFIRCDQFPVSRSHFLSRLSKAIGAGIENPEDLTPLRPFLSSREIILFLDNAESILDPQGTDAREIYGIAEELSQFNNICLCLTSRISTIPTTCESIDVPTLSVGAARNAFHNIYKSGRGRPNQVDNILEQLDFHPLSITLLATVAHHSKWDPNRLTREWERRRTDVLRTRHDKSLEATIELSLGSPMFRELGPDARELLGVVAFLPQGIDENNLDWLFPAQPERANIFDNFCILSLAYRSNGFITMLAPLRDYLRPKDPTSSPLLCATKDHYFGRLSADVVIGRPGFEEARWIASEDVNVENLLDVFTSVDSGSADIWGVCAHFMEHLHWHKPRRVVLGPKIEALPDDHQFKPQCLIELSRLFHLIGNRVESKRLLVHALKLFRERGDDIQVAQTLRFISCENRLPKEAIEQAKEALEIYKRRNHIMGQARSWRELAWSFYSDKQLDAAEEAASQAIKLLSGTAERFDICECHRVLGDVYGAKGEIERATGHYETALEIASRFNLQDHLFWNNFGLSSLSFRVNKLDDAHTYIERAKSHVIDGSYQLGRVMEVQAMLWYKQRRFEEAKSCALEALKVYEETGATEVQRCRVVLSNIETAMKDPTTSRE